jgi:hypothetical protein
MKSRLMITTCFAALLCCTGLGCSKNRLDITLEGPWVLYQDHQFDKNGHKVSVLIAIAPASVHTPSVNATDPPDELHHDPPRISTGDGYPITVPGIYCLTFDGECARKGPSELRHDGYSAPVLLTAKFPPPSDGSTIWDWSSASNGHTAVILPMPDSYSNGGVWFMHFARVFGQGYADVSGPEHSIGLRLHYDKGPNTFNILRCDGKPTVANCNKNPTDVPHTELDNIGTLSISMKAPATMDGCDKHVRYAYPQMLKLIDSRDLLLGKNVNQDIAYIDTAAGPPSSSNEYDPRCLSNTEDPQNPQYVGGTPAGSRLAIGMDSMTSQTCTQRAGRPQSLGSEIDCTVNELAGLPYNDVKDLAADIAAASKDMDPYFPRISQLSRVEQLLTGSQALLEALDTASKTESEKKGAHVKTNATASARRSETASTDSSPLQRARVDVNRLVDTNPIKNGNDCLSPAVVVQ